MLKIEVEGLEKLQMKLGHVLDAVKPTLQKVTDYAHGRAVDELERPVGATGKLAQSTKSELAPGPVPLHARVYHATPISLHVEQGRPRGLPQPPIGAMERWARRAGINVAPFVLARQIKERGTKGLFYMKKAAEATAKKMPELLREAAAAIERNWGK
jgi:hypothetical protein